MNDVSLGVALHEVVDLTALFLVYVGRTDFLLVEFADEGGSLVLVAVHVVAIDD